jgi:hypothetical protein
MVPAISPEVFGIIDLAIPASRRKWRCRAVDPSSDSVAEFPLELVTAVQIQIYGPD